MERRLMRLAEVRQLTTLGRTRIYELVAEGRFPQPVRLGPRRVAWLLAEVEAWIAERAAERPPAG